MAWTATFQSLREKAINLVWLLSVLLTAGVGVDVSACQHVTELGSGWLPAAMKAKPVKQVLVERQVVYSSAGHLKRWGTHVSKPILTSQCRQRFL